MPLELDILANHGGIERKNLIKKLEQIHAEYATSMTFSPDYTHEQFIDNCTDFSDKFSVLSLNCQSLNAKFNNFSIYIQELKEHNFKFSAICLQETWLKNDDDFTLFQINNYHCIHQVKYSSEHGGLLIYLHQDFNFEKLSVNKFENWEGLFIKINNNTNTKHIFLGNIYRPPKDYSNNTMQSYTEDLDLIFF